MFEENEEIFEEDNSCPKCGLRQYSDFCASCNIPIKHSEDDDKKKEDDDDEYDWREKR